MRTFNKIIIAVVLMASIVSCTNRKEPKVITSEEWENILGKQMITATFDDGMKLKFEVLPSSEVALAYNDKIPTSGQVTIPSEIISNGNTYRVVKIGYAAFRGCEEMTSITIPNSVTSIGDDAFAGCTGLTSITIPKSVTDAGECIFRYCTGLANVKILNGVTRIWDGAFVDCTGLTSVTIPNSVTSIGKYAFNGCTGITSITIPSSVTSIEEYAFKGCTGLTSITIPSSVKSIDKAFSDCEGLTSVTFQKGTTSICDGACLNCMGLSSVSIPNTVTRIGDGAFAGCTNLTFVSIPNSVTSIGKASFYACTGLASITIPESVTSIGYLVFVGCTSLTSVTIPQSVTSIGESIFGACTNLTNIVVADGNGKYDSRDKCNAIIETASGILIAACSNSTIPNGVTCVGEAAFSGHTGLTSISIPNSVTTIGDNAFAYCTGLTSISIPNSVTTIGDYAFANCMGLTSVVIPNGVTSIGERSFSTCGSLTSVIIPNSVTTIGERAFFDCCRLTSVFIPSSVTSIGEDAFWRTAVLPPCKVVYETDGYVSAYQGEAFSSSTQGNTTGQAYTVNGVSFVMKDVNGGSFQMGTDNETSWERPAHRVTVSDFAIGETEVTQGLWKAVMGSNPSRYQGDDLPVDDVSYNDIVNEFLPKLNQMTDQNFRLPTEAEWEFAARGGNNSNGYKYAGSNSLDNVAWYWKNTGDNYLSGTDDDWNWDNIVNNNGSTRNVKGKSPNELGIYGMSGNVWEWCSDEWHSYKSGSENNPKYQGNSKSSRVQRGGCWCSRTGDCRVTFRSGKKPEEHYPKWGFRIALSR